MTDELKPCLAYPCDGYMKENNYDASLECTSCQFIVADESEYNALVAGKQAAIDAALMKMRQEIETLYAKGNYTSVLDFYEDCLDLVSLWEGDNPLAEAQARIAELEAKNADLTKKLEAGWVRVCQTGLVEAQDRIAELERMGGHQAKHLAKVILELAEARKDAERYRWLCADLFGEERIKRNGILCRMPVMSYSMASTEIDAAMRQEGE